MKSKYYVALIGDNNKLTFITEVTPSTRSVLWSENCPAKAMSESLAKDVYEGLVSNWYEAVIIKAPSNRELSN